MTDEAITPIASSAQVSRCNHHVETLLTFALFEREPRDSWLLIDALHSLGLLTLQQAWDAISERLRREDD